MEPGGEDNRTINLGLYDHREMGTAVRSLIDQPIKDSSKSQENSPEKLESKKPGVEAYRNPI